MDNAQSVIAAFMFTASLSMYVSTRLAMRYADHVESQGFAELANEYRPRFVNHREFALGALCVSAPWLASIIVQRIIQ